MIVIARAFFEFIRSRLLVNDIGASSLFKILATLVTRVMHGIKQWCFMPCMTLSVSKIIFGTLHVRQARCPRVSQPRASASCYGDSRRLFDECLCETGVAAFCIFPLRVGSALRICNPNSSRLLLLSLSFRYHPNVCSGQAKGLSQ
jgi:hypothetical protein